MSLPSSGRGLTITNPLVLYRALLATNRILPDPAQHRLAIHFQKLYDTLKDYEPAVEYSHRLNQISRAVGPSITSEAKDDQATSASGRRGVWQSLLASKEKRDSVALTRVLTSHEAAMDLKSPKGLMLHGEVGTGKSMLVDLFADCLPTRKKRRWHFNTFMLETFAKLEQLRRDRLMRMPPSVDSADVDDYSLLWLARDLINTSPILFLDEFQLPDRAASKIMTNLMTSFFQLGGVLIATSNRMPEELAKAAGMTFAPPPSRLDSVRWRLGVRSNSTGRSDNMFAGPGEFAGFLDVLKARCEVWEMDASRDYRRHESETVAPADPADLEDRWELDEHQDLQRAPLRFRDTNTLDSLHASTQEEATKSDSVVSESQTSVPRNYFVLPELGSSENDLKTFGQDLATAIREVAFGAATIQDTWTPAAMRVYGRSVLIPRTNNGTTCWTFAELCGTALGPADYITLASTYHTVVLTDVPVLKFLQKNEARRFITLLDALYEARCKLLISAEAGPDELFFPDYAANGSKLIPDAQQDADATYAETFSEAYQDATAPFRPNISTQNPDYAEPDPQALAYEPDYTHARLQGMLAPDSLEDDPPNRISRGSREAGPIDPDDEIRVHRQRRGPLDFGATAAFTGEDERFAYKRARSRLWEMCGAKWWARDGEGWHKPVPREVRRWERAAGGVDATGGGGDVHGGPGAEDVTMGRSVGIDEQKDEVLFRHGASPFRTAQEPPPKFSWTHVWGTMKWGPKAGSWGQGVEGLKDRDKKKR